METNEEGERKTPSGLVLPGEDDMCYGKVVAVGRGFLHPQTLEVVPLQVKVGDEIAYKDDYGAVTLKHNFEDFVIMSEANIVAVVG